MDIPEKRNTARLNPYAQELARLEGLRRFVLTLESAQALGASHVLMASSESYTFYAYRPGPEGAGWERRLYVEDTLGVFHANPNWTVVTNLPRVCDRLATVLREEQHIADFRRDEDSGLWEAAHTPRACPLAWLLGPVERFTLLWAR